MRNWLRRWREEHGTIIIGVGTLLLVVIIILLLLGDGD